MPEKKQKPQILSPDDLIVWPDDHWCYRSELPQHRHKSDDYEEIQFGTHRWLCFFESLDKKDQHATTRP